MKIYRFPSPRIFVVMLLALFGYLTVEAQSFYIATGDQEIYLVDVATCNTTLQTTIDYAGGGINMNDIAFHPDGTLYGITRDGDLVSIDLTTGLGTFVTNIPPLSEASGDQFSSLIADSDGILLAADKAGRLISIDVTVPTFTILGTIVPGDGAAGDLSFNGGELYMTSDDNTLVKVNINDPGASTTISSFSVSSVFGVVSVFTTCTQINTYVMTSKEILVINDIATGVTSPACDLSGQFGGSIFGAAAINEAEASECKLECDINGPATGKNGKVTYDCTSESVSILDPTIAEIVSTSNLNEIVLSLSGIQDGTDETLEFIGIAPGGIGVSPSSGTSITLSNSADVDDYLDALALISYKNINADPTPGQRTISLSIKNDDGETDNLCRIEIDIKCNPVTLNVDLDDVPAGNNYTGDFDCALDQFLIAPDPVFTPAIIDEFVIELTDVLDVGNERLEINAGNLTFTRDSDTKITLTNNLGAGAIAADFTNALASAEYLNTANPRSAGRRTITVTGFLGGIPASTLAIAKVDLDGPDAGKFDPLDVCKTGNMVSLFDSQRPGFPPDDQSGTWTLGFNGSNLNSGIDSLDPGIDASGAYYYTLLNSCNVQDTASLEVTIVDPSTFDVIPDTDFFCTGSTVTLNGSSSGGTNPRWATDRNGINIVNNGFSYTINTEGLYYLLVSLNSCELVDSTDVTEIPVGNLDVRIVEPDTVPEFELCDDQNTTLRAITNNPPSSDPISYQWNTGQSAQSITVEDRGMYVVTAALVCDEGKDSIRIKLENCRCPIFVPNAFNPLSATGVNSSFYPITDSCATLETSNLSIFNRWGEQVHNGGEDNPWSGGGFPLDTYAWHFTYSFRSPVDESQVIEEEMRGFVILVR